MRDTVTPESGPLASGPRSPNTQPPGTQPAPDTQRAPDARLAPNALLAILAVGCFGTSMIVRVPDPMVPDIARGFAADQHAVALLASAFAFPYAISQPLLGPLGDALGKARIIKVCIAVVVATLALGAIAPSIEALFITRILGGFAAGGIIPLTLAMVGDRFPLATRQVALSQILIATLSGQMAGSIGAGLLAPAIGWRAVLAVGCAILAVVLAAVLRGLEPRTNAARVPFRLANIAGSYRTVFANPKAAICYASVFVEGCAVLGLFPYLAMLLEAAHTGGVREAGLVLAGMAMGGIVFAVAVRALLTRLGGQMNMIRAGGIVCGAGLAAYAGLATPLAQGLAFLVMGLGFYMVHNSLQTQATELAPSVRGAAVGLHAFFFFLGQAVGPVLYAAGFAHAGVVPTLITAALAMAGLGLATAGLLERSTEAVPSLP